MPRRSALTFVGALAALMMLAVPGFAGVVSYLDQTSWNAAVNTGTLTNIDFTCSFCSNPSVLPSYTNNTAGATFTGSGAGFTGVYWLNYSSYGGTVIMGGNVGSSTASAINMALPTNMSAVSMGLALASGQTGVANIAINGVDFATVNVGSTPVLGFYGLTSTTPISNITVSSMNGMVVMDNVSFGSLSQVSSGGGGTGGDPGAGGTETPDATTWLLGGSGLALLAISKKRFRTSVSPV